MSARLKTCKGQAKVRVKKKKKEVNQLNQG